MDASALSSLARRGRSGARTMAGVAGHRRRPAWRQDTATLVDASCGHGEKLHRASGASAQARFLKPGACKRAHRRGQAGIGLAVLEACAAAGAVQHLLRRSPMFESPDLPRLQAGRAFALRLQGKRKLQRQCDAHCRRRQRIAGRAHFCSSLARRRASVRVLAYSQWSCAGHRLTRLSLPWPMAIIDSACRLARSVHAMEHAVMTQRIHGPTLGCRAGVVMPPQDAEPPTRGLRRPFLSRTFNLPNDNEVKHA